MFAVNKTSRTLIKKKARYSNREWVFCHFIVTLRSVQYFQELYLRKVKKTQLNYRKHNFLALGVKRLTDHEKFLLGKVILGTWYVVVQFYPCFKFSFLLFQTHYHVIIIYYHTRKTKENKIWTKDKTEPQQIHFLRLLFKPHFQVQYKDIKSSDPSS